MKKVHFLLMFGLLLGTGFATTVFNACSSKANAKTTKAEAITAEANNNTTTKTATELPGIILDKTVIYIVAGEGAVASKGGIESYGLKLKEGESYVDGYDYTLHATVQNPGAKNKPIFWASSNRDIAKVNSDGNMAINTTAAGTVTITATVDNLSASCKIIIYDLPSGDNGVKINGVTWATRNVDKPGTFAASPIPTTDYHECGKWYQWNRKVAWSDYNITDNTMPEGTRWTKDNDPSPAGWRIPTVDELKSLLAQSVPHRWAYFPAIVNAYSYQYSVLLLGTEPNVIALKGETDYWSSSSFSSEDAGALRLSPPNPPFVGEMIGIRNDLRTLGKLVRPVKE